MNAIFHKFYYLSRNPQVLQRLLVTALFLAVMSHFVSVLRQSIQTEAAASESRAELLDGGGKVVRTFRETHDAGTGFPRVPIRDN